MIIRYEKTTNDILIKLISPNKEAELALILYNINIQYDLNNLSLSKEELDNDIKYLKNKK
jgi:hypothetical protein